MIYNDIKASSQIQDFNILTGRLKLFASLKSFKINPSAFSGMSKIPKYKKKDGRIKITFTNMNCKFKFDNEKCNLSFPLTKLCLNLGTYIKENVENIILMLLKI